MNPLYSKLVSKYKNQKEGSFMKQRILLLTAFLVVPLTFAAYREDIEEIKEIPTLEKVKPGSPLQNPGIAYLEIQDAIKQAKALLDNYAKKHSTQELWNLRNYLIQYNSWYNPDLPQQPSKIFENLVDQEGISLVNQLKNLAAPFQKSQKGIIPRHYFTGQRASITPNIKRFYQELIDYLYEIKPEIKNFEPGKTEEIVTIFKNKPLIK